MGKIRYLNRDYGYAVERTLGPTKGKPNRKRKALYFPVVSRSKYNPKDCREQGHR